MGNMVQGAKPQTLNKTKANHQDCSGRWGWIPAGEETKTRTKLKYYTEKGSSSTFRKATKLGNSYLNKL